MKISTILDNIDNGNLALPKFQRGYVWSRKQVRDLMQSLYSEYPVGGLLLWTTSDDLAAVRGLGQPTTGSADLLLDGQQRVTSIYGIVRGNPPLFFEGNDKAFTNLYFNLRRESFEFYGPVKMRDDPLWVSVTELFKQGLTPWIDTIYRMDLTEEEPAEYIKRLITILSIENRDLPVESITNPALSLDEVVDIFNRVNSGGTKLSKGDLALAWISASWPEAREQMNTKLAEWREIGYGFKLDWLLRVATVLLTDQASFAALRNVSMSQFADALDRAGEHCDGLLNLVSAKLGLDHDRVLSGVYSFPVMAKYLDRFGWPDAAEQGRLLYWYLHAGLWGRYSGSTETIVNQDLRVLADRGLDGLVERMSVWRGDLEIRPDNFAGAERGSRFYPLLYMMSRVGSVRDLRSGLELKAGMLGKHATLELHHIFPKARLQERGHGRRDRNAHANMCFLTKKSNLAIGARLPAEYLGEMEQAHPGVLASQWIPADESLWQMDRYPQFLEARRELLAAAANQMLHGLLDHGVPQATMTWESQPATVGDDPALEVLTRLCDEHGLTAPLLHHQIEDGETGEPITSVDAAWPDGLQTGLGESVSYLTDPDEEIEARLGELGWRFFTSLSRFVRHIETLLDIDIDSDGIVGEPGF